MEGLTERLHRIEKTINERFDRLELFILQKFKHMANEISNLQAAVANETTVEQSAITLIQELASSLKSAPDLAAVQVIADQINSNAAALAAAVTQNTPVAPAVS